MRRNLQEPDDVIINLLVNLQYLLSTVLTIKFTFVVDEECYVEHQERQYLLVFISQLFELLLGFWGFARVYLSERIVVFDHDSGIKDRGSRRV